MENIVIPIDLTAFALSPSCCDGPSKIAPITQPNYVGLRLDESLIQHDILDHVDYHLTSPAEYNVRLTDIGANPPELRRNRLGVYLHWSLPRLYRTASQYADSVETDPNQPADGTADRSQPVYRKVPNRWLVVRHLPSSAQTPAGKLPEFQTWVIESDRLRKINDIPDDVDLETDVSPFVTYEGNNRAPNVLNSQAEIFLGQRHQHSGWQNGGTGWSEDTSTSAKFTDLTVMSSGNPLFPDYVPHNGSVFSIVDSFAFQDPGSSDIQHLTSATADYFVIGWHSNSKDDPFTNAPPDTLANRLAALLLGPNASIDKATLGSRDVGRVLIHGAIYNVAYNLQSKPRSLADEAAAKFGPDIKMEPLSMGVTPLDAVLAFLEAHKANIESIFGTGTANVTNDLLQLATLLYAADGNYDSRVRAQDLLYTNNWASEQGGFEWKFDGKAAPGKPPASPGQAQLNALADLNELQAKFDTISRQIQGKRWNLFSEWWKYVSDRSNVTAAKEGPYRDRVAALKKEIVALQTTADQWKQKLDHDSGIAPSSTPTVPCKKIPQSTYFTKKDPTLCIAGLDSGWPADFLDKTRIQLDHQLIAPSATVAQIFGSLSNPVPAGKLQDTANKLLSECLSRIGATDLSKFSKGYQQFNNTNPFAPMFIEWEAIYYHIDRTKWEVGVRPSPVGHAHTQVRFSVTEPLYNDPKAQKDFRYASGRVLILPQPVFALQAIAQQVLDDPQSTIPQAIKDEIKANIAKLKFISAPLDGLTQHLLTRYVGTHVAPNVRVQGKKVVPLGDAVTATDVIQFGEDGLLLIDSESSVTPYGNLMAFDPATYTGVPFKGVTHGQMMLTKLNVVDKFGQSICVPTPKPTPRIPIVPPPSIHPCLSDYLTPDIVGGVLNTIYPEPTVAPGDWPLCRFIQLNPSINQAARINATFLNRNDSTTYPFWHETIDDLPESPLFGWIIVNYQDYGLQFFLADGTFYREVRVGGPSGTNASSKWLPFDPPQDKNTGNKQLDEFINQLIDPADPHATFLTGLFGVVDGAIKTMPYPPSDYAAFANSIVGKPLALINVGWSLEIAAPALEAQNTLGNLPGDVAAELASYKFPVKIGDADRPFDGVVGYFKSDNTKDGKTDWSKFYTYFTSPISPKIVGIEPANFPVLSPKFIDAREPYPVAGVANPMPFKSYMEARTAQYEITTMIIDPYTPLHAYSPILPITSLKLPLWTIQKAFTRMTGFFHLGPTLLSKDVPTTYDKTRPLNAGSWLSEQTVSNPISTNLDTVVVPAIPAAGPASPAGPTQPPATVGPTAVANVRLPISGKKGLWQWLQPYDIESDTPGQPRQTRFNALGVEQEDTRIRKDPAPYTFVEGYLQLARPLLNADVSGSQ